MEIIAHRGASGYAPENTISAFKKAMEMGAKAVEFDVQMTKDGKLIVLHDDVLGRTVAGESLVIQTDAKDIRSNSAGAWFADTYEDEKVPYLEEVLELFGKDMTIHLEIKKIRMDKRRFEDKIVDMVNDMGLKDNVLYSSFNHDSLRYMSEKYKDVRLGLLTGSGLLEEAKYAANAGIRINSVNPSLEYVDEEFVDYCHKNGLKVYSYTVNDKGIAEAFAKFGVDGIYSNYPNIIKF